MFHSTHPPYRERHAEPLPILQSICYRGKDGFKLMMMHILQIVRGHDVECISNKNKRKATNLAMMDISPSISYSLERANTARRKSQSRTFNNNFKEEGNTGRLDLQSTVHRNEIYSTHRKRSIPMRKRPNQLPLESYFWTQRVPVNRVKQIRIYDRCFVHIVSIANLPFSCFSF